MARVVVPGVAHHVTQRGNRCLDVFFSDDDREAYLEELMAMGAKYGVSYAGYCLMSNHVHLIAVPDTPESLASALGWTHNRYARRINFRQGWRGHLWQSRFYSCPLDELHAAMALRYVELNPVRAGLVSDATEWRWSSARAHVLGEPNKYIVSSPFMSGGDDWHKFLRRGTPDAELAEICERTRTGRPLGQKDFIVALEHTLSRTLQRKKPGPAKKSKDNR